MIDILCAGEFEAMYRCELCSTEAPSVCVFAHIRGFKHREKYLSMKYNIQTLDKDIILREAKVVTSSTV